MDRRKAVKNTAIRLFVKEGFQQTATARISREAGVATGTLFTYFDSKDDLITSIYAESKDDQLAFALKKVSDADEPKKMLKTIWKQGIKWALENPIQYQYLQLFEASAYKQMLNESPGAPMHKLLDKVYAKLNKSDQVIPNTLLYKVIATNQHALIQYLLEERNGVFDKGLNKQMFDLTMSGLMA